eukprot:GHVR01084260.1.p1 GENE.GHVR01084260.1~~GHVR01084260.1.p1  ORF type:complete len:101 (+),score=14.90 GHVR01084260.1:68-370(+)
MSNGKSCGDAGAKEVVDVQKFVYNKGYVQCRKDKDGINSLVLGHQDNCVVLLKLLIDAGADVSAVSKNRMCALIWASIIGNLEVVKYLIENGANINNETT